MGGKWEGLEIKPPDVLKNVDTYDTIYLGTLMGLTDVQNDLKALGVPLSKLNKTYVEISVVSRILFLKRFSERAKIEGIEGSVAECGVFRGEFAKEINRCFSDRICYLFDTFEGFDERDFPFEDSPSMTTNVNHLTMTSEEVVLAKLPFKDKCVVKKGYFPESVGDLDDTFAFVNLDMDLYKPTLEGLRYFYPRMSNGGVILVHDYFTEIFPNIEKAVDDYEKELGRKLCKMPIGDDISMGIVKY